MTSTPKCTSLTQLTEELAPGAYAREMAPFALDTYQSAAADTAIYPGKGTPLGLIYCGLKLAGEAGEVAEKIGKAIRDDGLFDVETCTERKLYSREETVILSARMRELSPERREALKGELGDTLWYIANAARELGFNLSDVAQGNLDKLADRKARGVLKGSGDNR